MLDLQQMLVTEVKGLFITTRCKSQGVCYMSVQGLVFPSHDAIPLNGQRRLDDTGLQLGTSE
jgi:hypothetical protein